MLLVASFRFLNQRCADHSIDRKLMAEFIRSLRKTHCRDVVVDMVVNAFPPF